MPPPDVLILVVASTVVIWYAMLDGIFGNHWKGPDDKDKDEN